MALYFLFFRMAGQLAHSPRPGEVCPDIITIIEHEKGLALELLD